MSHKKPVRIDPLMEALPPGGVDSHAHLDSGEFDQDRKAVIETARRVGVSGLVNVFLHPEDYQAHKGEFAGDSGICYILGIHPHDGERVTPACLDEIAKIFQTDAKVRAVGEIGLDYHFDHCPRDIQRQVFALQLELAKKLQKPVVIHCREAENDCLTLLEAGGFKDYPLLWHCFGGDSDLAKRILRNGWHISLPGSLTYPANKATVEAARFIPADRLLLETDCPYLSPVPWRGTVNQPANLVFTARFAAAAREESPEELWLQCGRNASSFFGFSFLA